MSMTERFKYLNEKKRKMFNTKHNNDETKKAKTI